MMIARGRGAPGSRVWSALVGGLVAVLVGGLVALGAACGGKSDPEAYEPPTYPPPPPKETRIDQETGAILAKPAPEWQWVEGERLKALEPTAVLGLTSDPDCVGWVAVTDAGDAGPRGPALKMLAARQAEPGWSVHVDEDVLYAGHTARRWEIQRHEGTTFLSERTSFLVEGPRLFALHARAREVDYGRRRRCLDALTAAFDVMMYEPPTPPTNPPAADAGTTTATAPDAGPIAPTPDAGPTAPSPAPETRAAPTSPTPEPPAPPKGP